MPFLRADLPLGWLLRLYKLNKIHFYVGRFYNLDGRALALMRIGVALVVIADLFIRLPDLGAHYTDAGIWPCNLINTFNGKPGSWSLHALSGSYAWVLGLFVLHFLFGVALLLGYKTRVATVLVWLLTISLHNRNIFVLQCGDDLLRLLLFWGIFLPWHQHYAIDAAAKPQTISRNTTAQLGYLLLLASVYFFTVNLKSSAEWHAEGSAIYYALSLEQLRLSPAGDWLYQFPALMKCLTWLVYYMEVAIPILLLIPTTKGQTRFIAFVIIILLHTGIGLTLYVGLFFVINMVAALGLLPPAFFRVLEAKLTTLKPRAIRKTGKRQLQGFRNAICLFAIVVCLIVNLSALSWFSFELRPELQYCVNSLRMDQYWGMFSPAVLKKDGWYVYYGIDSLGRQWDLRLNQDYVDFSKPEHIVNMYRSDRWRKLAENMQMDSYTFLRPRFGRYMLHQWNLKHPHKKMFTLNLYFMEKETLPDYKTPLITKKLFCVSNDY